MAIYMNIKTGSIDTENGWMESYSSEELEDRCLTVEEAFNADKAENLVEVISDDRLKQASEDSYEEDCFIVIGKKGGDWISLLSEDSESDTLFPAVIVSASGIECIRR